MKVHYNGYNVNFIGSLFATTYFWPAKVSVKFQATVTEIENDSFMLKVSIGNYFPAGEIDGIEESSFD